MHKKELIASIAEKHGVTKKVASEAVEMTANAIRDALLTGENVYIPGFGSFSVKEKGERKGRNPATGESVVIPAKKVVNFKFYCCFVK